MPVSESKKMATIRYNAKTYEPLNINVLQGERAKVAEAAQRAGVSLSAYVRAAIAEKMEREGVPEEQRLTRSIRDAKRPGAAEEV